MGLFDAFDLITNNVEEASIKNTFNKQLSKNNTINKIPDQNTVSTLANGNLFADNNLSEFNIELNKPKLDLLLGKLSNAENTEVDALKLLKSKKVTLYEKLDVIKTKVLEVLGKQRDNVLVIKTKEDFEQYVTNAIDFGRIAVDTETNNSTDPMTCDLMGLCLYYEGGKQAYIPVNHVDIETNERLVWQLTELDCKEQLQRIKDAQTMVIMHNGKFDYEVIKCTCDIELEPDWDTMIAAHTINENERMGLKWQYINKIDSDQEKYDIESLFIVPYKYVDPEIFALYAATDSMMTDKLYKYQLKILTADKNERLFWLFKNIEMPIVRVAADMELIGVCIDQDFGEKLRIKFNHNLDEIDKAIQTELASLQPKITAWKLSLSATKQTKQFEPKKSKMSQEKLEAKYPLIDKKTGKRYKVGKAPIEQLTNPINLDSPTQLAILFYDILNCPTVSKKSPRGTGKDELEAIAERTDLTLCKLILERRGIVKLISTYIDVLPALARHWPDGRIRYKLNSVGTDTGRFSSGGEFKFLDGDEPVEISGFNSQNIPSRGDGKITRMLFKAKEEFNKVDLESDHYILPEISEIETAEGWKYGKDLKIGDLLITEDSTIPILNIVYLNKSYTIYV